MGCVLRRNHPLQTLIVFHPETLTLLHFRTVRKNPLSFASIPYPLGSRELPDMEKQMSQSLEKPKGAMSVNDFAIWAGIGRTTAWKEIREGHLRAVKVSARTIIRFADAENWLGTRPQLVVSNAPLSRTTE